MCCVRNAVCIRGGCPIPPHVKEPCPEQHCHTTSTSLPGCPVPYPMTEHLSWPIILWDQFNSNIGKVGWVEGGGLRGDWPVTALLYNATHSGGRSLESVHLVAGTPANLLCSSYSVPRPRFSLCLSPACYYSLLFSELKILYSLSYSSS